MTVENALSTEAARRLKSRFLADLNHEIRTPLSGVLGMSDLLLETNLDSEQREYVQASRLCAESLLDLLTTALEFSSINSGNFTLEQSDFDLRETLRSAVSEQRIKAEMKGLKLTCEIDERLPQVVRGDAVRLREILSRLIDNAVKFTWQGEVEVRALLTTAIGLGPAAVPLTVLVRDTGLGFQDGEESGLGLGLELARRLVELNHGKLSIQSNPGSGSCVTFTLPFEPGSTGIPACVESLASPVSGNARILVVEDNEVATRITAHALTRAGYDVQCVASGEEALREASHSRYGLVLMDLQMPGINGLDAARQLRHLPGYVEVPILALTANATTDYRTLAREHGMQDFLAKPINSKDLLGAVAKYLG